MATLDVSEIIDDPEFASNITVVRIASTVDEFGINQVSEEIYSDVIATVLPASGEALVKLPEGTRTDGALEVWTRFRLLSANPGGQGDEILWQQESYMIASLQSYFQFGAGFCHATLIRKEVINNAEY